jgi:hypothetical protein
VRSAAARGTCPHKPQVPRPSQSGPNDSRRWRSGCASHLILNPDLWSLRSSAVLSSEEGAGKRGQGRVGVYHCGFSGTVARSTLADANENRGWPSAGVFAKSTEFGFRCWRPGIADWKLASAGVGQLSTVCASRCTVRGLRPRQPIEERGVPPASVTLHQQPGSPQGVERVRAEAVPEPQHVIEAETP